MLLKNYRMDLLRSEACNIQKEKMIDNLFGFSLWSLDDDEVKACCKNCLPISMAVYHILLNDERFVDDQFSVVIGEVADIGGNKSLSKSDLLNFDTIDYIDNSRWHAWIEVVDSNEGEKLIIDLTYAPTEGYLNVINFDAEIACEKSLEHVAYLTSGKDVRNFYKRLINAHNKDADTSDSFLSEFIQS